MIAIDTEDKIAWCEIGADIEQEFCDKFGEVLGVSINPEKQNNKYVPDLINANGLADLKSQRTPFYRARSYGLNPLQCVVMNRKDAVRYYRMYPNIEIYFWQQFSGGTQWGVAVPTMEAVFFVPLSQITAMIQAEAVPLHHYQRRGDDPVNARCSYLIDTALLLQVYP